MGLAVAAVLGHDAVIFLDDDEVVLGPDFMKKALYALGQETRAQLPILAKTGFFYDRTGSPFADTSKAGITQKWWTKRFEFNRWMRRALAATRISRSNYVCGGLMALHARASCGLPSIRSSHAARTSTTSLTCACRGLMCGLTTNGRSTICRLSSISGRRALCKMCTAGITSRAKHAYANRQNDLTPVTAASLMPYPGPWISDELDERVQRTALVRSLVTREHAGIGVSCAPVARMRCAMRANTKAVILNSRASGPPSWTACGVIGSLPACSRGLDEPTFAVYSEPIRFRACILHLARCC